MILIGYSLMRKVTFSKTSHQNSLGTLQTVPQQVKVSTLNPGILILGVPSMVWMQQFVPMPRRPVLGHHVKTQPSYWSMKRMPLNSVSLENTLYQWRRYNLFHWNHLSKGKDRIFRDLYFSWYTIYVYIVKTESSDKGDHRPAIHVENFIN